MSCTTQANLPQHEGFCKLSARVSSCWCSYIGESFRIDLSYLPTDTHVSRCLWHGI